MKHWYQWFLFTGFLFEIWTLHQNQYVNLFTYLVNLCSVKKWNKVKLNWIELNWDIYEIRIIYMCVCVYGGIKVSMEELRSKVYYFNEGCI